MIFYGDVFTINNVSSEPGDEIAVYDPQGIFCGHFVVTNAGLFNLTVYGDDTGSPEDEGASLNEDLTFKVWDASEAIEITLTNSMFIQKDVFGQPQIDTIPPKYSGSNDTRGMGISAFLQFSKDDTIAIPCGMFCSAAFGDIDNDSDLDMIISAYLGEGRGSAKVYQNTEGSFSEITAINLPEVSYGSVVLGDYDHDDDLDLLLTGYASNARIAKIYQNSNARFSEAANITLTGVEFSSAAFGDYDNDGDLDILITGDSDNGKIAKIYQNSGGVFLEDTNITLIGLSEGSAAFGDYDNDSDLDILLTGNSDNGAFAKVYQNTGGQFSELSVIFLTGVTGSSSVFGDYDNDGDLDILISGYASSNKIAKVYQNTGAAFSENTNIILDGISEGSASFGDLDNDGDLDILLSGSSASDKLVKVYRNTGGSFTEDTDIHFDLGYYHRSAHFVDYDNDGDLDIMLTGETIKIYRNNNNVPNTSPSAPMHLTSVVSGNNVLLSWSAGSDAETLSVSGLSYNLCIGSDPGKCDILSPMSLPLSNNTRLISERGMFQILTTPINHLNDGTYYWRVQTIDTTFAGSSYSMEYSFTVVPPFSADTNTVLSGVYWGSCNFVDYDTDGDLDIFLTGDSDQGKLAKMYRNTGGIFSEYTGINLPGVEGGAAAFGDFDADGDLDLLLTGNSDTGKMAKIYQNTAGSFSENTGISLPGVEESTVALLDYDNDGDLDILITGNTDSGPIAKVFQNTDGLFSEDNNISLTGVKYGAVAIFDCDNDSDLDILLTGYTGSIRLAKLYRNSGGLFNEDTGTTLTGVDDSSVAVGDYDNDGDLDFLLCGYSDDDPIAKMYQNTGGSFSEASHITLTGVEYGSVAFGDDDNDGDLDILLTGVSDEVPIAIVYRNTGGNFSEDTAISLSGVGDSSVAFGDYDNDGDLDILLTGINSSDTTISHIYKNNTDIPNTLPSAPTYLTSVVTGNNVSLSWTAGSDTETLSATGLNYNLCIGSTPGTCDILSPMSLSSGFRQIPEIGLIQPLSTTVNINDVGTYYWRIQTIDSALSGSSFSDEYSFTITDIAPIPGNNGLISSPTLIPSATEDIFNWSVASDSVSLTNDLSYRIYTSTISYGSNIAAWESFATAQSDWINNTHTFVLNKTNASLTAYYLTVIVRDMSGNKAAYVPIYMSQFSEMTGIELPGLSNGSVAFADIDNDGDLDIFMSGHSASGYIAKIFRNTGGNFSEYTSVSLPGVMDSSVAFADYDNDNDLDMLLSGNSYSGKIAKIYRNTGGSFSEYTGVNLPGVMYASVAFGDYDNDGDVDMLMTGQSNSSLMAKLFRNTGDSFNEDTENMFTGFTSGSAAFGDLDLDSDLDLLMTGFSNTGYTAKLYSNTGGNLTENTMTNIPGVTNSSIAFGDYDNDGDLDLFISGSSAGGSIAKIFRNYGGSLSEETSVNLPGVSKSSAAFGDYDNDGDLDLFISGESDSGYIAKVFRNSGGSFSEDTAANLPGVYYSSVAFGDFDNDNDLDILITGASDNGFIARIFRNNNNIPNTSPAAPTILTSMVNGNHVILSWSSAIDTETPSGLNYNLCIGTSSGRCDIVSPMSLSDGYRLIPASGTIQTLTTTINNLSDGTYYWQIQAIDTAFAGSEFSNEATFTIGNIPPVFSSIENQQTVIDFPISIPFQLTDTEGGPIQLSVSGHTETIHLTGTNITTDGTSYTINASPSSPEHITMVILSSQAGDTTLTITFNDHGSITQASFILTVRPLFTENETLSLPGVYRSSAAFGDYDNDGDLDIVLTGKSDSGRIARIYNNSGGIFTEAADINLTGVDYSSVAFGDYDNDGDLDMLISGDPLISKLYQNTGDDFVDSGVNLLGVRRSSAAFGDYDNDGDLDILLSGYNGTDAITLLYRNTDGSFLVDPSITLPGVYNSSVAFGDYDNDDDLDILLSGDSGNGRMAKIYQNTGGFFCEDTDNPLPGVYNGSVGFGDFDNDGDLDMVLSGSSDTGKMAKVYQNTNGSFTENTGITLPGIEASAIAWADFDNDGDLDLFLSGNSNSGLIAQLYKNTAGSFCEYTAMTFPGVSQGAVAWGDYDNDGDLDILLTGYSDTGSFAKIYQNNMTVVNTSPAAPQYLTSVVTGQTVQLSWSAGSDAETFSAAGLNYNIQIGSSPGAYDIKAPMALPFSSGYRQIPERGDFQNLTTTVQLNETGTCYWRVQSIDTSFSGSSFSNEYSFTITDIAPAPGNNGMISSSTLYPQASEITLDFSVSSDTISLTTALAYRIYSASVSYGNHINAWEQLSTPLTNWMIDTHTYLISNQHASTDYYYVVMVRDESGNKAIYQPLHMTQFTEMDAISLEGVYRSSVIWGDYDNDADLDILLTGASDSGRIAKIYKNSAGSFAEDFSVNLQGVDYSSVAFGDYDNDGDLDILLTGDVNTAKIYRNSDGIFTEDTAITLSGVRRSAVAFGDYDNDGDLDILLTGHDGSGAIAKVYQQTGGSYSEDTAIILSGVYDGSVAFGDYDNDGDLDILLSGYTGSSRLAKVFKNSGGIYNEDTDITLPGVNYSSAAFGDYDNDGDLDILLSGNSNSGKIAKIYENSAGRFNENTEIELPGVLSGAVAFGDYDNDGDLDILLSGSADSGRIAKVYQNTGDNFYEDRAVTLPAVTEGSAAFGDYDNDGDLDMLLSGHTVNGSIVRVYRNNHPDLNTAPTAPLQLTSVVEGDHVRLSWSGASDTETISPTGLSYNVTIGSSPGACDILASMALPLSNGYRQIPARGAIQTLTSTINNLNDGKYYWAVQTIDTAFAGSEFSQEASFIIGDYLPGSGNALDFDGIDDHIILPAFNLNSNTVTISAWIKLKDTQKNNAAVVFSRRGSTTAGIHIINGNELGYEWNNDYWEWKSNLYIPLNTWVHIALTIEPDSGTLYLNGVSSINNGTHDIEEFNNTTEIGRDRFNNARFFNGQIDDVRIWNVSRTESQIREHMCKRLSGNEIGLFACYRFDHTSGTTLVDATGNGYTGTLYNFDERAWIPSGAAIGDVSIYDYTGATPDDFLVKMSASSGDQFTATGENGTFDGIHLYLVTDTSHVNPSPSGIDAFDPDHYWGVYPIGTNPTYEIEYHYTGNSFVTNENAIQFAYRPDNSVASWTALSVNLDTSFNTFSKTNEARGEYILGDDYSPNISFIDNHVTLINSAISVALHVSDIQGGDMLISADSSNLSLIAIEHMHITGAHIFTDGISYTLNNTAGVSDNLTLTINPTPGMAGNVYITITVDDSGIRSEQSFELSVLPPFTEDENMSFSGVISGSAAFGDYDNDGDLDILLTGDSGSGYIAKVYQNTRGSFSEDTGISLTGVSDSSVAFGDYDNDGDLDILLTGESDNDRIAKVYRNTGGSFSEDTGISLAGVSYSSVAFGDYDNDGDLDILLTGSSDSGRIAKVYRNIGGNFNEDTGISLTGVSYSSVAFGDYDNDGDLDILLTGSSDNGPIAKVYRNTGGSFTEDNGFSLPGVVDSSVAFGDYDNDGDLDILLTGHTGSGYIAKVYRNTGGSFTEDAYISLTGVYISSVAFGDYDNDGDIDILITGESDSGKIAKIYKNTDAAFIDDTTVHLPGIANSTVLFGDYDNDGDLDIFLSGETDNSIIARIYRNNILNRNTAPSAPTHLTSIVSGNTVQLSWSAASDAETLSGSGLNYNLCIGASSGSCNIVPPMSLSDGYRQISARGMIQGLTTTITLLPDGTYYWRVQAIDTAFAGSEFSNEATFTISNIPPVISSIENQHTVIDFPISIPFHFTDTEGGDIRISVSSSLTALVMPENISFTGTNITSDGSNYTVNATASMPENITMVIQPVPGQAGDAMITLTIDDGAIVEKAFAYSVLSPFTEDENVSLPGVRDSSMAFGDYDNDGDLDILLTGSSSSGYIAKVYRNTGGSFSEDTGISLSGVSSSSVAFGDYDNDGDLDILLTGYAIAKVYRNTGGSFSEDTGFSIPGVSSSSVAFGDYDNDGDLDILLTGDSDSGRIAKVYRNTGGSFSEDTGFFHTGVSSSSVAFGDYDNDGDLDILLTGDSDSGKIAKVYRNTGGSFSEDTGFSLTGVDDSSVVFGDYDNDGDLDILLTGSSDSGIIAKVYRNTGGSFSEDTGFSLTGVENSSVAFGDYDNDGDLDILLTGYSDSGRIAKVYRNTGGSFSEDTGISLTGVSYSSVAFGDYDNDGDLDILLTGSSVDGIITRIYKNNHVISNTSPSAPSQLTSFVTGQKVELSWSAGSDAQTISPTGLNYNLIIGSSSGAYDIAAPMSLPLSNGYHQIAKRGLIQRLTTTVNINETGTYYWRVQTIDTAFSGSSFFR
jgi:predicted nucleotidyltransferase